MKNTWQAMVTSGSFLLDTHNAANPNEGSWVGDGLSTLFQIKKGVFSENKWKRGNKIRSEQEENIAISTEKKTRITSSTEKRNSKRWDIFPGKNQEKFHRKIRKNQ